MNDIDVHSPATISSISLLQDSQFKPRDTSNVVEGDSPEESGGKGKGKSVAEEELGEEEVRPISPSKSRNQSPSPTRSPPRASSPEIAQFPGSIPDLEPISSLVSSDASTSALNTSATQEIEPGLEPEAEAEIDADPSQSSLSLETQKTPSLREEPIEPMEEVRGTQETPRRPKTGGLFMAASPSPSPSATRSASSSPLGPIRSRKRVNLGREEELEEVEAVKKRQGRAGIEDQEGGGGNEHYLEIQRAALAMFDDLDAEAEAQAEAEVNAVARTHHSNSRDVGRPSIVARTNTQTDNSTQVVGNVSRRDPFADLLGHDDAAGGDVGGKDGARGKARVGTGKRARLDEERLLGDRGFPALMKTAKRFKGKGKGHETSDLANLITTYQLWAHQMFPKSSFKDAVTKIESLCHSRGIQSTVRGWRDEEEFADQVAAATERQQRQAAEDAEALGEADMLRGNADANDNDHEAMEDRDGVMKRHRNRSRVIQDEEDDEEEDFDEEAMILAAQAEAEELQRSATNVTPSVPAGGGGSNSRFSVAVVDDFEDDWAAVDDMMF